MAHSTSQDQAGLQKTWKLSPYELQRTPHKAVTDNREIDISPQSLHSEFMCPICLDLLKKTMTTKVCLHRFCSECIITALRSGNKECPTCRTKLISKRSLQADPNFDLLISKLYPSRDEYDALQERQMQTINSSHSQVALVNSITEGIKSQSLNRPNRKPKPGNGQPRAEAPAAVPASTAVRPEESLGVLPPFEEITPKPPMAGMPSVAASSSCTGRALAASSNNAASPMSSTSSELLAPDEVEVIYKPHPIKMIGSPYVGALSEATRYIKTRDYATVDHLKHYLRMRLSLDHMHSDPLPNPESSETQPEIVFTLYIALTPENICALTSKLTLRQIVDKFWKLNRPLELYYSIDRQ